MKTKLILFAALCGILTLTSVPDALAQAKKPNILVIWGDDIGIWNISHNSQGMMGYRTPNIDRIANEGAAFTDYDWFLDRAFVLVPLQQLAGKFLMTMKDYPPSQTPGSFNLEKIQKQIEAAAGGQ
ncbi:MAG TPA: hypothetical protein VIS96_06105 [Terrimicrobiaceae bacterium]